MKGSLWYCAAGEKVKQKIGLKKVHKGQGFPLLAICHLLWWRVNIEKKTAFLWIIITKNISLVFIL